MRQLQGRTDTRTHTQALASSLLTQSSASNHHTAIAGVRVSHRTHYTHRHNHTITQSQGQSQHQDSRNQPRGIIDYCSLLSLAMLSYIIINIFATRITTRHISTYTRGVSESNFLGTAIFFPITVPHSIVQWWNNRLRVQFVTNRCWIHCRSLADDAIDGWMGWAGLTTIGVGVVMLV